MGQHLFPLLLVSSLYCGSITNKNVRLSVTAVYNYVVLCTYKITLYNFYDCRLSTIDPMFRTILFASSVKRCWRTDAKNVNANCQNTASPPSSQHEVSLDSLNNVIRHRIRIVCLAARGRPYWLKNAWTNGLQTV